MLPKLDDARKTLLLKYFKLVDGNCCIDLYFDTFSELIDNNFGDNSVEKLNGTLFDKVEEALALIDRRHKLNVTVHIRDYGDYDKAEADHIIEENVLLRIYSYIAENTRKRRNSLLLLGMGAALLVASYFLSSLNLPQLVFDIINICGTLCVWEFADITFIERNDYVKRANRYIFNVKINTDSKTDEQPTCPQNDSDANRK